MRKLTPLTIPLKWSLFWLLLFLLVVEITGQTIDSSECYIITFKSGRVTEATIDSIQSDSLYYRLCPEDYGRKYEVPLAFIQHIQSPLGTSDPIIPDWMTYKKANPNSNASLPKNWVFSNKSKNIIRKVNSKRRIKVTYWGPLDKLRKTKGKLHRITETSMVVMKRSGELVEIPKHKVTRIGVAGILGPIGMLLFWAAAFLGLGALAGFVFFSSADAVGYVLSFGSYDPNLRSGIGCLPIILSFSAATVFFIFSYYRPIRDPFSDEWEVTNKYEAQENQDELVMIRIKE